MLLGEPLAAGAGNSTGRSIDDRIQFTPCHNSVMSWGGCRPSPLQTSDLITLDTLGRARPMTVRRWAWLIGMTDAYGQSPYRVGEELHDTPFLQLEWCRDSTST